MTPEELRTKTLASIFQLRKEENDKIEARWLRQLEVDKCLKRYPYKDDIWEVWCGPLDLVKEDGGWLVRTRRFHCMLATGEGAVLPLLEVAGPPSARCQGLRTGNPALHPRARGRPSAGPGGAMKEYHWWLLAMFLMFGAGMTWAGHLNDRFDPATRSARTVFCRRVMWSSAVIIWCGGVARDTIVFGRSKRK